MDHSGQSSTHTIPITLASARSHMANERTHLAYFRTSLSLMSFGISLNRFSLYLRMNKLTSGQFGFLYETEFVGLSMVILGIVILSWALYRFEKVSKAIENHTYSSSKFAMILLTCSIILMGGLSAVWLIIKRG